MGVVANTCAMKQQERKKQKMKACKEERIYGMKQSGHEIMKSQMNVIIDWLPSLFNYLVQIG